MNAICLAALAAAVIVALLDVALSLAAQYMHWLPNSSGLLPVALVFEKLCIAYLILSLTQALYATADELIIIFAQPIVAILLTTTGLWLSYASSANCHWIVLLLALALNVSWDLCASAAATPADRLLIPNTIVLFNNRVLRAVQYMHDQAPLLATALLYE